MRHVLDGRATPGGARAIFGGELPVAPGWGLHFVDMTLPSGDSVNLANNQIAAWEAPRAQALGARGAHAAALPSGRASGML